MDLKISFFQTVPKILFGCGAVKRLAEETKALGATKVVVVTDHGLVAARVHLPVIEILESTGLKPALFSDVEPDPKVEIVNICHDFINAHQADFVIGLGGGSAMDISKAAAVMVNNDGPINQYAGVNLVPRPGLPTILIPTTAGTLVLFDPELTVGLPPNITASTGLDALIHAIESYTGSQATFLTEPLAMESIRLIGKYLRLAYADGANLVARTGMLQASLLAGMAFANTQTAGAHACALSLGGKYHLPHGIATSLMLPAVMRFNAIATPKKFADIAEAFGEPLNGLSTMEKTEKAISAVERLINDVGFKLGLENYGVKREDIPMLAKGAIGAVRLWNNNPRRATEEQVQQIFEDSFLQ
jgi:alcohol dehydrogenase class IV